MDEHCQRSGRTAWIRSNPYSTTLRSSSSMSAAQDGSSASIGWPLLAQSYAAEKSSLLELGKAYEVVLRSRFPAAPVVILGLGGIRCRSRPTSRSSFFLMLSSTRDMRRPNMRLRSAVTLLPSPASAKRHRRHRGVLLYALERLPRSVPGRYSFKPSISSLSSAPRRRRYTLLCP